MGYMDLHVHTSSSPDALVPAAELCVMAKNQPVEGIGFVAHLDMHPEDFCHGGFREDTYLDELTAAEASSGIGVLRGLEVGEPHRFLNSAEDLFTRNNYDFITGAVHWLGSDLILDEKPFLKKDPLELVRLYYMETLEMINRGGINILAHTGIFRRGMARAGLPVGMDETQVFPDLLHGVLESLVKSGIALEVNTSGLRRPEKTTYPGASVLRLYRSLGGTRVTLGSDTHRHGHAFFGLEQGASLLVACGFDSYGSFKDREYVPCPLQLTGQ